MPKPYFNRSSLIAKIVRVDHAGEVAAVEIYKGQLLHIANESRLAVEEMMRHEVHHMEFFSDYIKDHNIRPTIMMPMWSKIAYYMGCVSGAMGTKYAMLLTDAVEDAIEKHYTDQIVELDCIEQKDLRDVVARFCHEEQAHRVVAQQHVGEYDCIDLMAYRLIKAACAFAIRISSRI